jgi:alcohol dehydrogenase class IV
MITMTPEAMIANLPFVYEALPMRVLFGVGTRASVRDEALKLGVSRVLIVCGPSHEASARQIALELGELHAGTYAGARMHTPLDVTQEALARLSEWRADGIVAIGGGSATGLGKALALRTDLPQIVLPTTYAGSEMTPILGETKDGVKTTQRSAKVLPETVIYDVDLSMDLPVGLSGVSGMNAIAHSVEALYARDGNPIVNALALESIRALVKALPAVCADPHDRAARAGALYGAWLAGMCLGAVGMSLHHKLCHTLGGSFDMPHAQTHAVILPHALAYNAPAIPEVMARLGDALGVDDVPLALYDLNRAIGAPRGLRELGMPEDGIDRCVELALANPYWNPRPLARDGIYGLLTRAYLGEVPSSDPRGLQGAAS